MSEQGAAERLMIALGRAWAEDQSISDAKAIDYISIDCHIQPEDVQMALDALAEQGWELRKVDS